MKVENIDHLNISGPENLIEEVREFYEEILGLKVGSRPNFSRAGYWLYASDKAIIHLTVSEVNRSGSNTYFDHFAFRVTGLPSAKKRLDSKGIEYKQSIVSEMDQVQLFLSDPAGNGVELNFVGEPAA
ncbi:VOC family protein [Microbulbifer harenosus]|uniref:Diguanylate cyclase n=2 Tax=Microbulbifer harenosus TaxID=2576840 RepID=A0ABY2UHS1_9GAMM|nr:diguanylate cyclase [Microbulbifer harenosus]